jgi:hypothetical protein
MPAAASFCDQLPPDHQGIPGYLVQVWRLVTRSAIEGRRTCVPRIAFTPTNRHVAAHVGNPVARGGGAASVVSVASGRTDKSSDLICGARR